MKNKMNPILVILSALLIFSISLSAVEKKKQIEKYEGKFTTGKHNRENCKIECPPFKDNYFGRIADFNARTGITQCYVYRKNDSSKILGTVTNKNERCKQIFTNLESENKLSEMKTTGLRNGFNSFNDLIKLEEKYKNYINLGSDREFVNAPKYMIAGLTVDDEILNVKSTIENNELMLKSKYSIYPNSTVFNEEEFKEKLRENHNFLAKTFTKIIDFFDFPSPTTEPNQQQQINHNELTSSVKMMLSNSVIFIINFISLNNQTMIFAKTFLLFTVLPLTVGFAVISKITKKLGDISDTDDVLERIILGISSLFIFYFSTTNIQSVNDEKISQSSFHQMVRPIFYKGAEIADLATGNMTNAYLRWKLRDAGFAPISSVNNAQDEITKINVEQKALRSYIDQCFKTYDTKKIKQDLEIAIGLNTNFPPEEKISRYSNLLERDSNLYVNAYFKNSRYETANEVMSISGCYKIERKYYENKETLEQLNYLVEGYKIARNNDVQKKQLDIIANMQYRNNAELGFISAPLLATTSIMIDNIGVFKNPLGERFSTEKAIENYRKSGGYEVSGVAENKGILDNATNWTLTNLPYLMLPFADTIRSAIKDIAKSPDSEKGLTNILKNAAESTKSGGVFSMALVFIKGIAVNYLLDEKFINILSIFLTIIIMKYLLSYLPIIILSTASFAVIFFYYLSLEIYYLVIPFLIAFAFSTNQSDLIKDFMKKGLILAFKPVLIVVSIVLALFAKDFFDNLNTVIINYQLEPLFALTQSIEWGSNKGILENIENVGISATGDYGLLLFKGFLLIANTVIAIITIFYLVLNGANMILDIFGIRDGGFDAQNTIGNSIDNKSNKWSNPI